MRPIAVGRAPPPAVGCGSIPGDDMQDIPSAIRSSASVLTTIVADVTDSGGPPQQIIAQEPVAFFAGEDRWMSPWQIASQDVPSYQEDVG